MRSLSTALIIAALAAAPALAQTPSATVPDASVPAPGAQLDEPIVVTGDRPAKEEDKKVVCKRVVPTGSIIPTRTCRSRGEWEEEAAVHQETSQRIKDLQQRFKNIDMVTSGGE